MLRALACVALLCAACDDSGGLPPVDLAAPDLSTPIVCKHNAECPMGTYCIPPHTGCPTGEDGGALDDILTASCNTLDFDPAFTCVVSGDSVSCSCTF